MSALNKINQASPDQLNSMREEYERLKRENEQLKAKVLNAGGAVSFKMTDKGGISVYGLGRFPVTLYPSQWDKLFSAEDKLKTFIADNAQELNRRGEISKAAKVEEKRKANGATDVPTTLAAAGQF